GTERLRRRGEERGLQGTAGLAELRQAAAHQRHVALRADAYVDVAAGDQRRAPRVVVVHRGGRDGDRGRGPHVGPVRRVHRVQVPGRPVDIDRRIPRGRVGGHGGRGGEALPPAGQVWHDADEPLPDDRAGGLVERVEVAALGA